MEGFRQTKRDTVDSMAKKGRVVLFQPLDMADSLLWYVRELYERQFDQLEWVHGWGEAGGK